ncbi:MAG: hypothetical protein ACKV19_17135 [Verrucomicrobiales bacterium]
MNDPAPPSLPPQLPQSGAEAPRTPRKHQRLFTPIDADPPRHANRLGRVAPRAATRDESLEADSWESELDRSPSAQAPKQRPAFVANPIIQILAKLHIQANPELAERRLRQWMLASGFVALAALLVFAVASSVTFRPPAFETLASAGPSPALPRVMTEAEISAAVEQALATLDAFLNASSPEERNAVIADHDLLPPLLHQSGSVPALAQASVGRPEARLHVDGSFRCVLVPLTHAGGLPHTAAVVHHGDRWVVDWRSALTPESMPWRQFIENRPASPVLFRVLLTRQSSGEWSLIRPGAGEIPLAVEMASHSRIGAELAEALEARSESSLAADVYLAAGDDRQLNIVDWTKDKWSL